MRDAKDVIRRSESSTTSVSKGVDDGEGLLVTDDIESGSTESLTPSGYRISFEVNVAKVEGKGEDADPLLYWRGEQGVLAVFDGMGGAGSASYTIKGVVHSGAYVASRLARRAASSWFDGKVGSPVAPDQEAEDLQDAISQQLRQAASDLAEQANSSRLKSKLFKRLPTTVAALVVSQHEQPDIECRCYWAGDSRCYALTPRMGLQQLTVDDITSSGDALDNLTNESPLSNFASGESEFRLTARSFRFDLPVVLLVATDGCFGYLASPAHFEYVLLESMQTAGDVSEWRMGIIERLSKQAGDDFSMAVVGLGWASISDLKRSFSERHRHCQQEYVEPLGSLEEKVDQKRVELKEVEAVLYRLRAERDSTRQALWERYRRDYGALMVSQPDSRRDGKSVYRDADKDDKRRSSVEEGQDVPFRQEAKDS